MKKNNVKSRNIRRGGFNFIVFINEEKRIIVAKFDWWRSDFGTREFHQSFKICDKINARSKCHPNDTWNEHLGTELAVNLCLKRINNKMVFKFQEIMNRINKMVMAATKVTHAFKSEDMITVKVPGDQSVDTSADPVV